MPWGLMTSEASLLCKREKEKKKKLPLPRKMQMKQHPSLINLWCVLKLHRFVEIPEISDEMLLLALSVALT